MAEITSLLNKAVAGNRLSLEEGTFLLEHGNLLELGIAASQIRHRLHPDRKVTYDIDRNINYTNICQCQCRFCAFYRRPGDSDSYALDRITLFSKIDETLAAGGTELLIQGGLHPDLNLDFFTGMLRDIKTRYDIHIRSLSPPEIVHLSL